MKPVVVILGPTAVGKSDLGITLAMKLHGQIINADAIQVYRGLDIGSGKVDQRQQQLVKHHLLDILDPNQYFDIASFQTMARSCIDMILDQGECPIVVGGSGLYIKALLYDYRFVDQKPLDPMVLTKMETMDNASLYAWLNEVDPTSAEKFHPNNRIRIMRALQIALSTGSTKSEMEAQQSHRLIYDAKIIHLDTDRDRLRQRISIRVDQMVKNGLLDEIQSLLDHGYTFEDPGLRGIGYKEFRPFFDHQMDCQQCIETVKIHSYQFAKRQRTFFRHQFDKLMDVDPFIDDMDQVIREIESWWFQQAAAHC